MRQKKKKEQKRARELDRINNVRRVAGGRPCAKAGVTGVSVHPSTLALLFCSVFKRSVIFDVEPGV